MNVITNATPDQIDSNAVLVSDEEFAKLLASKPGEAVRLDGEDVGFVTDDDSDENDTQRVLN